MSSNRPGRLRRHTAEQLLDGAAGSRVAGDRHAEGEAVASLLAAASSPPRAAELAGEDAAVTAFRAEHLVPVSQSRRGQMIKSPLAKILTLKVGAVALTLGAGGAALAASTGAFTPSAHGHANLGAATGGASVSQSKTTGTKAGVHVSAPVTHASASVHATLPPMPKGLLSATEVGKVCRTLANTAYATVRHVDASAVGVLSETGLQSALDSTVLAQVINDPQFSSLVATVEGKTNVANYCGLVMHVAELASPSTLASIPATVLDAIPGNVVGLVPASAIDGVPAAGLSKLPIGFVSKLASKVLTGLPASILTKLPASLLSGLLSQLPAGTLAHLPIGQLTSLLSQLPVKTVTGILSKLPTSVLSQVLRGLPSSLLRGLPSSLLRGLPSSLIGQLGLHL